ncbi:MAG TPA: hypothetical protein VFG96_09410 [Jiangellaceae bacterium]|nr:hypothetical protein [Jiangellaceae bacterium]
MHDLAALLARPDVDIPAIELASRGDQLDAAHSAYNEPVLDRAALVAYRRRLAQLDEELDAARDLARQQHASDEREQLTRRCPNWASTSIAPYAPAPPAATTRTRTKTDRQQAWWFT